MAKRFIRCRYCHKYMATEITQDADNEDAFVGDCGCTNSGIDWVWCSKCGGLISNEPNGYTYDRVSYDICKECTR